MLIGLFAYGSSPAFLTLQMAELSGCHRAWYSKLEIFPIWFFTESFLNAFCMICYLINASLFGHSAYDGQCVVFNLRLL